MITTLDTVSELSALFAQEQLPLLRLQVAWQQSLIKSGPQLWNSRAELPHPEDLPAWLALARGREQEALQIGFSGRGINSWSLHLNLVQTGLAIFLQCRWGNAYDDAAACRSRIEGVMSFVDMLIQRSAHAGLNHALPSKERLIVSFADHYPSRWQWSGDGDAWHADGDFTLLAALGALDERIEGKTVGKHNA